MSAVDPTTRTEWLSPEELTTLRGRMPVVYVEAVPVRLNVDGRVVEVGLLLRVRPDGTISRAVVSGRVLYGETVREALLRNLEKDLGPASFPQLPPQPAPFTVAEYFPDPSVTGFHDPRQHAVSLAFVVPVIGECQPSQDSLDVTWVTPTEAMRPEVRAELAGGHDRLVGMALASTGTLP